MGRALYKVTTNISGEFVTDGDGIVILTSHNVQNALKRSAAPLTSTSKHKGELVGLALSEAHVCHYTSIFQTRKALN
uniref:Uncharacterized protein n=1 Tax=Trichobilharzia regenti TaxID=157069 RepID=A0AA85J0D3_TRIRE|nr:unnamed protein product [Trichobilharzia regenti]